MDNESEKIIADQVKKLPREVRDALTSEDLHKNIAAIGEKHHLHIDQVGLLENEVVLVMMGLASAADFPSELTEQLSLQAADAEAIANDVSDQIFLPIREAMKKIPEEGPSVVMPSASNAAAAAAAITPMAPKPAAPVSTPAPSSTPVVKTPDMHAADLMLSEPTVSIAPKPAPTTIPTPAAINSPAPAAPVVPKVEAPKPVPPYKADPYREPPE